MFKNKFFVYTIIIFMWAPYLFSQNVSITLQDRGLGTYQDVFLSDLDFLNLGQAKELFAITLQKFTTADIRGEITINLIKDSTPLVTIITNRFIFPIEAGGPWTFTNVELSQETFRFTPESQPIEISETNTNEDQSQKLIDELKATNKIPFGVYRLIAKLKVFSNGNEIEEVSAQREIIITITNPYILSTISPGNSLNSGFVYQLYTLNPVFLWNGNSGNYQIVVFKKQSDFSSPEDILNSQPVWESERTSSLFAEYPASGVLPLEYGSVYVWQVRSFITTSSGENMIQSELWEFIVLDPSSSGATQESMAKQEFENLLRQLLGDNAEPIINEIGNYKLSIIRVNGEILSIPEFYKILEKYRDQENEISDIILRSSN